MRFTVLKIKAGYVIVESDIHIERNTKTMYELIRAGDRTFYIDCPAKIGIYKLTENEVCLIDSGGDKDAGRRIRKILDENGWKLRAILNTHSNADHIGGNKYLQDNTGCKIFSGDIEGAFTEHPLLEPSFLYGGYPCRDLRHKFLMAQPSKVCPFSDADFPKEIEVISLKGHFFDMVGFRTPDDIVFLADCLSSRQTLDKYKITFIYDVAEYLNTLESIKSMKASLFIPSHAAATDDIYELAQYNINTVNEIARLITDICTKPATFEEVLQKLFEHYCLKMTCEQYVLVGNTVRSYLAWLKDSGRLDFYFENNKMLWKQGL